MSTAQSFLYPECLVGNFQGLTQTDKVALNRLTVPLSQKSECDRIELLRDAKLLESSQNEEDFDRLTNLTARHLKVIRECLYFMKCTNYVTVDYVVSAVSNNTHGHGPKLV